MLVLFAFALIFGSVFLFGSEQTSSGPRLQLKSLRGSEENIAYRPADDQPGSNLLDVRVPEGQFFGPRPVFVWIHGGGWFSGDRQGPTSDLRSRVLNQAGFIFVSVNYREIPLPYGIPDSSRPRFPAAHLDAAQAVSWVARNIDDFGGDPTRLLLGGDSAGGHIAALLATRSGFLDHLGVSRDQIRGVVSLDAVALDVARMMSPSYRLLNYRFQQMAVNAFGTSQEEALDPRWSEASPIRYADPGDPPVFFVVPTTAPDRWTDAQRMARRLGQNLQLSSWRVLSDHNEIVSLFGRAGDDQGLTRPLLAFLRSALSDRRYQITVEDSGKADAGGLVSLSISAQPEPERLLCRLDKGPEIPCPDQLLFADGLHTLEVRAYGPTGKAEGEKTVLIQAG